MCPAASSSSSSLGMRNEDSTLLMGSGIKEHPAPKHLAPFDPLSGIAVSDYGPKVNPIQLLLMQKSGRLCSWHTKKGGARQQVAPFFLDRSLVTPAIRSLFPLCDRGAGILLIENLLSFCCCAHSLSL